MCRREHLYFSQLPGELVHFLSLVWFSTSSFCLLSMPATYCMCRMGKVLIIKFLSSHPSSSSVFCHGLSVPSFFPPISLSAACFFFFIFFHRRWASYLCRIAAGSYPQFRPLRPGELSSDMQYGSTLFACGKMLRPSRVSAHDEKFRTKY
jgi:hypothetical protein